MRFSDCQNEEMPAKKKKASTSSAGGGGGGGNKAEDPPVSSNDDLEKELTRRQSESLRKQEETFMSLETATGTPIQPSFSPVEDDDPPPFGAFSSLQATGVPEPPRELDQPPLLDDAIRSDDDDQPFSDPNEASEDFLPPELEED